MPPDLSIDPDESLLSAINPTKSMVGLEFRSDWSWDIVFGRNPTKLVKITSVAPVSLAKN